jgi:DNA-binding MarR family transcriptional regulator
LRYRVKKGEVYLIKEQKPDLSIEVFKDMLNCGFVATVFSREKEEEIEKVFGKVKTFWLAESSKAKDAIEPRFSEIESRIKALGTGNNAVLLDRMDYLISKNGFDDTLKFVQRLFERAYHQKLIVILALDPKTLSPRELRRLEKETKRVEPKVRSRLPEDIHEILKFVYSENRIGKYPSYKDIHEKFKITRTTARNRIKRLKTMKFLVDRKKGRTKFLEVTDEGREQF